MKWFLLLAGAVLVAIVLALPGPAPVVDASPKAPPPPAPVAVAVSQPQADSAPASAQPPIVLRGLIYRGKGSSESQALLGVEGKPQQLFRAGEPFTAGDLKSLGGERIRT